MRWKLHRMDLAFHPKPGYGWVCILLMIAGCASTPKTTGHEEPPQHFEFSYQYQSLGAGNSGVMLPIIPFNRDAEAFSMALRASLQDLEYSIVKPDAIDGPALPQETQIETDAVDLSRSVIENHNLHFTQGPMPLNARYRLSYALTYGVANDTRDGPKHFWLTVRSRLERRAAAGGWHQYTQPYSGNFFSQLLSETVSARLDSVASNFQ